MHHGRSLPFCPFEKNVRKVSHNGRKVSVPYWLRLPKMIGRNKVFLLAFLTLLLGPTLEVIELAHDQGKPSGSAYLAGSYGHAVSFSPPSIPWRVQRVRIYGYRYGNRTENMEFVVEIWTSNRSILHSSAHPYAKFTTVSTWVNVDIPGPAVVGSFFVVIYTSSTPERGIGIVCDSSLVNRHSEIVSGKRILTDWSEIKWLKAPPKKEETNWMVRVVGSTPIAITTSPTTTYQPSSSMLFGLDMTQLIQVAGGGVAAAAVPLLGWLVKTRKRRFVSSYLTKVDSVYNEFFMNREECRKRLEQMKGEIVQLLKKGKIDEPHFTILDTKLERYLKDLA